MNTTISISKETRNLLQEFGKMSESYDDVIRRMFNNIKLREAVNEFLDENEFITLDDALEWTKLKLKEHD